MDIAGMALGILAIVSVWTPLGEIPGWITVPLVVVGLPLSVAAYQNARRNATRIGIAIAGMATNLVAAAMLLGRYLFW